MLGPRLALRLGLLSFFLLPLPGLHGQARSAVNDAVLVPPGWLADRLGDPQLVLLQLGRDSGAYLAGHIPGARFVPLGAFVVERDGIPSELPEVAQLQRVLEAAGVSNDSRVVLYGDPLPAARMFFTLDYLGMGDRVALLDGGVAAWQAEGQPVTSEPASGRRGSFEPRLQPQRLVDAAWVAARLGDPSVVLLDARSPEEWSGQEAGEGVLRPGHIPGAANVYWRTALTARDLARLQDAPILAELLERSGVAPGKTVVTSCRIGVQASLIYFVARYLGYQPRMYDGSFVEWSRRAELPVAR